MRTAALIALVLLPLWAVEAWAESGRHTPSPGATDTDPARCLELVELVANRCPKGCIQRHCNTRCIPPFADTGRCAMCQELCLNICDSMYENQTAMCRGEPAPD